MISVMSGRFVGNMFNLAIQDMQIHVKKLPFLEVDLAKDDFGKEGIELTAGHIMSIRVRMTTLFFPFSFVYCSNNHRTEHLRLINNVNVCHHRDHL
jgi:hypothetical protein